MKMVSYTVILVLVVTSTCMSQENSSKSLSDTEINLAIFGDSSFILDTKDYFLMECLKDSVWSFVSVIPFDSLNYWTTSLGDLPNCRILQLKVVREFLTNHNIDDKGFGIPKYTTHIELPHDCDYKIYDAWGNEMISGKGETADITSLPNALYYLVYLEVQLIFAKVNN